MSEENRSTEAVFTEKEFWETVDSKLTTKDEVRIVNLTLRVGDTIEVIIGRNEKIRGRFRGWSTKLFAMQLETEDSDVVIPYKYIKMIRKLR